MNRECGCVGVTTFVLDLVFSLKKKAAAIDVEVPRQAMDLVGEMKRRGRNPKYSGIDN